MSRERSPSPTNAANGLSPNTTNGFVHHLTCSMSMSHMQVASATHASPAVNSTYELVQRLLLIGKDHPHMSPAIIASAPTPCNAATRERRGRSVPIHRPVRTPSMQVAIAGKVERIPSGSHVREP